MNDGDDTGRPRRSPSASGRPGPRGTTAGNRKGFSAGYPGSRHLASAALVALCALGVSSCGALVTTSAHLSGPRSSNDITPLADDELTNRLAYHFGLMALFSHVAYRKDLRKPGLMDQACDYRTLEERGLLDYGMPRAESGAGGWQRWDRPGVRACVNEDGLFYETYVYKDPGGRIKRAVIAFRGSENDGDQFAKDWSTNFSPVFGFQPRQYKLANRYLATLVPALGRELEKTPAAERETKIRIYATGHSLGGGLAQQAGYAFKDVRGVFAFNSSPVTNWSHLRLNDKIENDYPTIYRVSHQGEVLQFARNFAGSATGSRYRRHDLSTQIYKRKPISGHSMEILACTFAAVVADQPDAAIEARHHFSSAAARSLFEPRDRQQVPICAPAFRKVVNMDNVDEIEKTLELALESRKEGASGVRPSPPVQARRNRFPDLWRRFGLPAATPAGDPGLQ